MCSFSRRRAGLGCRAQPARPCPAARAAGGWPDIGLAAGCSVRGMVGCGVSACRVPSRGSPRTARRRRRTSQPEGCRQGGVGDGGGRRGAWPAWPRPSTSSIRTACRAIWIALLRAGWPADPWCSSSTTSCVPGSAVTCSAPPSGWPRARSPSAARSPTQSADTHAACTSSRRQSTPSGSSRVHRTRRGGPG